MADIKEIKVMTLERQQQYDTLIKQYISDADTKVLEDAQKSAQEYADSLADNYDTSGTAATKVQELADGQVKNNTDAITSLTETHNTDKVTLENSIKATDDKAVKNAEDIVNLQDRMNTAEDDIDAVETDLGNVDSLSTANKTVVGAINEVLAAVGTGGTAAVVTITTDVTSEGALKSYTLKQGTTTIGVIDIPKDMFVESGEVVKNPEGQAEGTYIKLVLANVAEPLFINVGTLVDIYKAQANATQIQLSIDSATREISATIVAGSVGTTELADGAVTTVKIADANVTLAKLSTAVQASLAKADVAAPQSALDTETSERKDADDALDKRLQVVEEQFGTGEGSVDDKIAKAKQEAINAAAEDATTKANAVDAKVTALTETHNADKTTLEAKDAELQNAIDAAEARLDTLEATKYVEITETEIAEMFETTV